MSSAPRLSSKRSAKSRPPSTAERWRTLERDLDGMYRLQAMQMTLIRNLQRELQELRRR